METRCYARRRHAESGVSGVSDENLTLLAFALGLVAVIYGLANLRKNGDGFVAVVCFVVAAFVLGWAWLNR